MKIHFKIGIQSVSFCKCQNEMENFKKNLSLHQSCMLEVEGGLKLLTNFSKGIILSWLTLSDYDVLYSHDLLT